MLAETCVFGKQLHGFLSCGPVTLSTTIVTRMGSAFFLEHKYVYVLFSKSISMRYVKIYRYIVFFRKKTGKSLVLDTVTGQTLSRSYGRCFAEFLDEESLVHLGLLDLSTCVGLRYG